MMGAIVIYFLISVTLTASLSIKELQNNFGSNLCIEGSFLTVSTKEKSNLVLKASNSVIDLHLNNVSVGTGNLYNDQSILSKLHELAQFNEIDYSYKLIKEEGPSHHKVFTISLTLGDEEFISEGFSLKKAQQNVAAIALENSEYEHPIKTQKDENPDTTTPTVSLNNLCAKLGIGVEYFLVNKDKMINLKRVNEKTGKTYLERLNDSMYSEIHIRKDETLTKGPFKVGVKITDLFFYGTSHTIQSARHEAASNAIDYLIKVIKDGNLDCIQEGSEDKCKQAKANLKSPISLVYEAGQLRHIEADFEIIEETGPPHKRTFVTRCTLGHLSTTGEGKSKKESKKVAAEKMLERISELPEVSQEMQVKNILKDKKKNKKKRKILKTNFDVISAHVDNIISSIKEHGLLPSKSEQDESLKKKPSTKKKLKRLSRSKQEGILELSNLLQFEIQFMDFNEDERFYTLMSLHINPEHICLGQGSSLNIARDGAAKGGLILLQNIDLENHLKTNKLTVLESEVRNKIDILLREGVLHEQIS